MNDQNFYAPPQADINPNESGPAAPRSIGEAINIIASLYVDSFKVLLPIALLSGFFNAFVELLMTPGNDALAAGGMPGPVYFLGFLISALVGVYLWTVGFVRISNFRRTGEANNEDFSQALVFFIPICIFYLIYFFGVTVGALMCILPGIFVMVLFLVGDVALIVERLGPIEALQRGFNLVWGNFWFTFALCLIFGVVVALPIGVIQVVVEFMFSDIPMLSTVVTLILAVAVFPFWIVFMFVVYESLITRSGPENWENSDSVEYSTKVW